MSLTIPGIIVTLAGDPIGWPRPRFVGGRVVPSTGKAKRYASALERAAREAVTNLGGADAVKQAFASHGLSVSINATFSTRHIQRHGLPHTHKPDVDNIAKLMDRLMVVGALGGDDSRVVDLKVVKVWGARGVLSITVRRVRRISAQPLPASINTIPIWLQR